MKAIAVIQHVPTDGMGFFEAWAHSRALAIELFPMYEQAALPADIQNYAGLAILGGPMSANDCIPYFSQLIDQIQECIKSDIPVLGHCLGGQLMSLAQGGTVQLSENAEIGWSQIQSIGESGLHWFGPERELSLFQWHGESFSIPANAVLVAAGQYCKNQAFVLNEMHLGMQFHCEVDAFKIRLWVDRDAHEITEAAHSPGVQKIIDIMPSLSQDVAKSQVIATHIYDTWAKKLKLAAS